MKSLCGILLFVAYLCHTEAAHTLLTTIKKCKFEDEACILQRANEVVRSYPQGYDDLDLKGIDPLTLKQIRVTGNPKSPVNLDLTLSDVVIRGLSNLTITKFSGFTKDPKDFKEILCDGVVPLFIADGKYKTSGKFLVLPITGEGNIHISIKNSQMKVQIKVVPIEKNGKKHVKVDKAQIKVKVESVHIDPENLFNGEKTLADTMVKVINENWEVLWDEMSPKIINELLLTITGILDTFLGSVPYEEMFA